MIKFTYTKPNGEISERVGIVVHRPTDLYSILDLSELDADELMAWQDEFHQYQKELKELRAKYGLDLYWKNFKSERMTDLSEAK